jgi:hypothetical protein
MPLWINTLFLICFGVSILVALFSFLLDKNVFRLGAYVAGFLILIAALYLTIGFPFSVQRQSFGEGISAELCVAIMFVAVILGIMATYAFNLADAFSWQEFARPVVVSPLILLPLIGSVQGASLQPLQLICFAILAFQNGFFWQQVLRDAKPRT